MEPFHGLRSLQLALSNVNSGMSRVRAHRLSAIVRLEKLAAARSGGLTRHEVGGPVLEARKVMAVHGGALGEPACGGARLSECRTAQSRPSASSSVGPPHDTQPSPQVTVGHRAQALGVCAHAKEAHALLTAGAVRNRSPGCATSLASDGHRLSHRGPGSESPFSAVVVVIVVLRRRDRPRGGDRFFATAWWTRGAYHPEQSLQGPHVLAERPHLTARLRGRGDFGFDARCRESPRQAKMRVSHT
jgi:hypothetical protein